MTPYQTFIHQSRYARYRDDLGRRETWHETVTRYLDFFEDHLQSNHGYRISSDERSETYEAIINMSVMPSMRALMTAGEALRLENAAGFNCSYLEISEIRSFAELLYILMCGTGVGFSVEERSISQLPQIPQHLTKTNKEIVVDDSKLGWAESYLTFLEHLYRGEICDVIYDKIRPAGARLKTFGGRASGPEPLRELFNFTLELFFNARGRRLNSLEAHTLCCKIGEVVVVGGVRRSALISISDLGDTKMRDAKTGDWYSQRSYLAFANNSAAYENKPERAIFDNEWHSIETSMSGERGIYNRGGVWKKITFIGRRDPGYFFGLNPCGEINLRSNQFCNLTEKVVRENDTLTDMIQKVRIATRLGTWQSTLVNFRFLSDRWKHNTAQERLLGVSMTGIFSNPLTCQSGPELRERLTILRETAIEANAACADAIGIERSAAITTVKPSGTVSQLVNSPSGIHPDHSRHYIRRVRGDNKDPLTQFLIDAGIPNEPAVGSEKTTTVFSFPIKSQAKIFREDITALQHLELVRDYNTSWSEHAVSCTISLRADEWKPVGEWVYKNFDDICGLSFLPFFESDTIYQQTPYESITEETYKDLLAQMPTHIAWEKLAAYDKGQDHTKGAQTLACTGNACEIVDLT